MTHELKSWPRWFEPMKDRTKRFDIRKDDRQFEVGDILRLREWDPEHEEYTGRELTARVTYIIRAGGLIPITVGYCVMSVEIL